MGEMGINLANVSDRSVGDMRVCNVQASLRTEDERKLNYGSDT